MMKDDRELRLKKARGHASVTAAGLATMLGPVDAAGVLIGAGFGVLADAFGAELAVTYLRELADEVEQDGDFGGRSGHA